jgi:hypothetical protein
MAYGEAMRRATLLALLLCACSEKVAEPPKKSPEPAPSASAPLPQAGAWFEIELPKGWTPVELKSDAERGVSEGMWRAPKNAPGTSVIVFKPIPFEGDAKGFSEQSLFAYSEMGMGNMIDDGEAEVAGVPARRSHGVVALGDKSGVVAYWFFVKDGSGAGIQCGGTEIAGCEAIVKTFKIVAPLPKAELSVPASPRKQRALPGSFSAEVRDDWQAFSTVTYPDAVFQLRAGAPIAGMFPSAVMRRRAWKGAADGWQADFEKELDAEGSKVIARDELVFLGDKAPLLEVQSSTQVGGYRALVTGRVRDGVETRVSCASAPQVFDELRADCMTLLKTLAEGDAG